MTPEISIQTAIRAVLVDALDGLVDPLAIRIGGIRPASFPAVVLGLPTIEIKGHAAGAQIVAGVDMLLHLWTRDDDAETAQQIGAAVLKALLDAPSASGLWLDGWDRPRLQWVADPHNEALHGAVRLSAVARWSA